ncbi:tRNA lysidine(34) synthetase TilS [Roseateles puraquae]|uniref:tRNA(Ile)-lysidine synthase n=1 Tax=Roseateles puraquae TaxID=431059 RepID=A0A254NGJ6_9BURK|nr:tRNA lysidine(34) synthetase TilS [Roseateles puraquae]MDG0852306.1 tRNA lysidine(34) synthetase TilS [Roseateles puraquae]OWR04163.1 tRNA lysidine(34) synthetase TilS [Roseateles puraquae]
MAASATPRTADSSAPAVAVAFSGGLDSTALLHAVTRAVTGQRVVALHVHHGLQPQADAWAAQCRTVAEAWGASFICTRLSGRPGPAESLEAWARAGRHQALHDMTVAAGADLLLLAHHRRDQAETFVLQAMRGAGLAGLAGMPRAQWRDGVCWARPWLDKPRESIEAYALTHGLRWIDDPSNAEARLARNRLRQQLWPAFPAAESGLAQAARWAQEAGELAEEIATEDLVRLAAGARLDLPGLMQLSPARRSNALRHWLSRHTAAPASLIARLLSEWRPGGTLNWPAPGGELHAWRDGLFWRPLRDLSAEQKALNLSRPGHYPQPGWYGAWQVEPASQGIAPARLAALAQRERAEGDQFQRAPNAAARSFKKAAQQAGLAPWLRHGPLLVDAEGRLVAAAGLGMDARAFAAQDEPALAVRWVEDSALPQSEGESPSGA